MKEIAIYGKGGIGKSTMSANISAALSRKGKKVLQIGCDPKHDSTRLLMGGKRITTVLDYIKVTGPLDTRSDDILFRGYNDIGCIEAGGPKPGVGCAGRGIITAFELLEKFHVKDDYDIIIYDVLGDVVCGGFAVPIRREYADTIFLVTSGEYMSIYAANNILRGIKNYDDDKCRVAGIIYNSRNVRDEDLRVNRFAQAVKLPVFTKIPRDDVFAKAERENCTVVQLESETGGTVSSIFEDIADKIIAVPELHPANPLTDEDLEELILYGKSSAPKKVFEEVKAKETKSEKDVPEYDSGYLSKNVLRDEPLHGCAFNGAMSMSIHLNDVVVLGHSPKSCTYMSYQSISSSGRRRLFERGSLLPVSILPNIMSSEMDESDMVFGGTDKLLDTVKKVLSMKPAPKAIVIISSCPAGIIGDDIDDAKELETEDTQIVTIKTEGNLTGDYLQGMLMAYTQLAEQIIDKSVKPQKNVVNVIFEKVVAKNTEDSFLLLKKWLDKMDVRVNCRFLCNTSYESLKNFQSASLNLLANRDYTGIILEDFFKKNYGAKFFDRQMPVGFDASVKWLRAIGKEFGKEDVAEGIINENTDEYARRIAEVKKSLAGKKIMVFTFMRDVDWILKAAFDADMEVSKICLLNASQDEGFRSELPQLENVPIVDNYKRSDRQKDIDEIKPDIILSNYESDIYYENAIASAIPMCPDAGFFSGLVILEKWAGLFTSKLEGEWKDDQSLFNKYYSR